MRVCLVRRPYIRSLGCCWLWVVSVGCQSLGVGLARERGVRRAWDACAWPLWIRGAASANEPAAWLRGLGLLAAPPGLPCLPARLVRAHNKGPR